MKRKECGECNWEKKSITALIDCPVIRNLRKEREAFLSVIPCRRAYGQAIQEFRLRRKFYGGEEPLRGEERHSSGGLRVTGRVKG